MIMVKENNKNILINLIIFIVYGFSWFNLALIFNFIGININNLSESAKIIFSIFFELLIAIFLIIIYNKKLKEDIKDYLKNALKYFSNNIKYWLLGIGISTIINSLILTIFKINTSDNQAAINSLFKTKPLYVIISAVIVAPIIEELIFRNCFRNIFKSNITYIIMSGLVFGLFHVVNVSTSFAGFAYTFSYAALGSAFAYMMVKKDNIIIPMSFHALHNGIILLLQLVLLITTK